MIRSAGQTGSQSGFDIEPMRVYVDDREQLMRLFGRREKVTHAAKVVVFLERHLEGLGKSHGHASSRHEFQVGQSVVRIIDDGVENEIETSDVSADDGADLGCVTPLVPMRGVQAEFEIDAVENVAIGRVRGHEQSPQFESIVYTPVCAVDRIHLNEPRRRPARSNIIFISHSRIYPEGAVPYPE